MTDLISKEAVLEIIDNETRNTSDYLQHNTQINIRFAVDELPTVEAKPVVHGEWERIYVDEKLGNRTTNMCTACGEKCWLKYDYCPNCGADMRGGKNEKNI